MRSGGQSGREQEELVGILNCGRNMTMLYVPTDTTTTTTRRQTTGTAVTTITYSTETASR